MEKSNVIEELENLRFTIIDKIYVDDETENVKIEYLKAYDPNGNIIFINLDTDINMEASEDIIPYNKIFKASIIPQSVKMGLYKCLDKNICGIMVCSSKGLCAIKHENENARDENLIFSTYQGTPVIIQNNFEAYPIINLSDILNNYNQTLYYINIITQRIVNSLYVLLTNKSEELVENTNLYNEKIKNAIDINIRVAKEIANSLQILYKAYNSYTDKNNDNVKKIIYNIQVRNNLMNKIFSYWNDINNFSDKIKNEINKLDSYIVRVDDLGKTVNNVLSP